jgi:transposase InsO family protein
MNNTIIWKSDAASSQHHHIFLPSPSLRAIIIGESGCGKTTLLLNLLLQDEWLDYDRLILCGRSLHQPEYKLLATAVQKGYDKAGIRRLFEIGSGDVDCFINQLPQQQRKPLIDMEVYDSNSSVPDPHDLDYHQKTLCVFDDMMTDSNQNLAESYYTRGRHNNISSIYISQSYHRLPRHTIRSNANCIILFKQPNKDLRHIHDDVITDMSYEEFRKLCDTAWQAEHGNLIINRARTADEGKYIVNLQQAYIPTTGRGLVNSLLQKLPMKEMHLTLPKDISSEQVASGSFNDTGKYSYCGPFTKVDQRLTEGYKGVNSLDEACRRHDVAYKEHKNVKERNVADDILAEEAAHIANDETRPEYERRDARLVTGIMGMKSRFGLGLLKHTYYDPRRGFTGVNDLARKTGMPKSAVEEWLHSQDVYTLHKPIRHRFKTRRVIVSGIDDQWQADLVEMRNYKDRGYNYILTVIDVFSKFAWAVPIKRKTGDEVASAFRELFKHRNPRKLHTDKGLEFINRPTKELLKQHGVHWFATENETKAQVVERFNRTLKNRMWRYFTKAGSTEWVKVLPDLIHNYNTTRHRSIGMTPVKASMKENEALVYKRLFPSEDDKQRMPKFRVGDHVRITVKRGDFRKGYRPNFTREVFIVVKVLETAPTTYRITAMDGEVIEGSFYEQEMVKITRT